MPNSLRPRAVVLVTLCLTLPARAEPLRWGSDERGGAPNVFQDPMQPNRVIGFEVDVADLLAAQLEQTPVATHAPWDSLLNLLVRQDVDVVINGIEVAEEKKRVVALSRPYYVAEEVLTVRRNDPHAPRTLAQLKGRVVGTLTGAMPERIAASAGAIVHSYDSGQSELYDDLRFGRLDAVLLEEPIAKYYGEIEDSLEVIHADFGVVEYAIAVRLDDETRLARINAALTRLIESGALRNVYEQWGVWNSQTARLFHDSDASPHSAAVHYQEWKDAVMRLPPFVERVRTRYPSYFAAFARGATLTLVTSCCAMLLAVLLGVALALARRYGPQPLRLLAVAYIEFFRGTPLLVQLTMVYFGLPELGVRLDPFVAGVLALGLNYAAAEAENYRAGLESVPVGQREAASVLGLSTWQTLRRIVAPQAIRISLPPMTNDFIALLKYSSLVSVVTLTELTKTYTTLAASTRDHLGLGLVVAIAYLVIGLPFAQLARFAERYFGRHLTRERSHS